MGLRRFPHRRPAAGDIDPLELLSALPPGAAQEFDALLQEQYASDARFAARQVLESSLPAGIDEYVAAANGFLAGRRALALVPN